MATRWSKLRRPAIIVLVVSALILVVLARLEAAFSQEEQLPKQKTPIPVKVAKAEKKELIGWVVAGGTAKAARRAYLDFTRPGKVAFIGKDEFGNELKEGSLVRGPSEKEPKGQIIAALDSREQDQSLLAGRAGLMEARQRVVALSAELEKTREGQKLAESRLGRLEVLADKGSATKAQLEEQRTALRAAKLNVLSLEAQVKAAQAATLGAKAGFVQFKIGEEGGVLHAPFFGVLSFLNVRMGDRVATSYGGLEGKEASMETTAAVVIDPSMYEITLKLPVADGSRVEPGMEAYVQVGRKEAHLDEANPDEGLAKIGQVHSVSPAVDPMGRFIRVRVRTEGASDLVSDGAHIVCKLKTEVHPDSLVVPKWAVFDDSDGHGLFVVDSKTMTVRKRVVGVGSGPAQRKVIHITDGIEPGELVVTDGRRFLSDGDLVRIVKSEGL